MKSGSTAPPSLPWKGKLRGKVALVTGSSRGVGKGIALALGEAGATVYVTGRTVRGKTSRWGVRGTIHDTADEVTARGGVGIPVRCDHAKNAQIRRLVDRIDRESGRLDILVNNAFGGEEGKQQIITYDGYPFWKHDFEEWWDRMFTTYLRAAMATSMYAIPLMRRRRGGLIVNTLWWNRGGYLGDLFFDLSSSAMGRMAYGLDLELRSRDITVVAISPGWTRTEHMDDLPAKVLRRLASPEYTGRGVVHLALDPRRHTKSGRVFELGALAREYRFRNVDGRLIDYHADVAKHPPPGAPPD